MMFSLARFILVFIYFLNVLLLVQPLASQAHDLQGLASTRYPVFIPPGGAGVALNGIPAASLSAPARATALQLSKLRSDKDAAIVIASSLGSSPHTVSARGLTKKDLLSLESVVMRAKTWQPGTSIKVCFYELANNRASIAAVAVQWLQYGNLKFDFGAAPDLRTCSEANELSEIRITFRERPPYWVGYASLIGTDSAANKGEPSMILKNFDRADLNDPYFQSVVLHEFGHALGFHHEHQSPAADCERQFNMAKVKSRTGWSDQQIKANLSRLQVGSMSGIKDGFSLITLPSGEPVAFSTYDSKSIMHYSLPLDIFNSPVGDCYIPQNVTLSAFDQKGMSASYPAVTYQIVNQQHNKLIDGLINGGKLSTMEAAALRVLKRN